MNLILEKPGKGLQCTWAGFKISSFVLCLISIVIISEVTAYAIPFFDWTTVVNNDFVAPGDGTKTFFSYNQPSINDAGTVVFRARAKASGGASGGGPTSGIFTRDMSLADAPITAIAVRGDEIPSPNNIIRPGLATFNEFPSFPRIDASSDVLAFRGQSQPSWNVILGEGEETRSGTSGLYATSTDGSLSTGIRNIEAEGGFPQYLVPGQSDIRFEQFPGSPSPTGSLITFKGNLTDTAGNSQTGVYYRDLEADSGNAPVIEIAKRGDAIPGEALPEGMESAVFDSTAPPSAAAGKMVFTGLDNEESPTAGGIFMADLVADADLTTIAGFQTSVLSANNYSLNNPDTDNVVDPAAFTLTAFGEGLSFDGRYVGFWAGWGDDVFQKTVECGSDGNSALSEACREQDNNGTANDGIYTFDVIANQGIFLADSVTKDLFLVAQTGDLYEDFLFWNFSGKPSDAGAGDDTDEAEGARWRSSAFLAIDGNDVVFKALSTAGETGLYGAMDVTDGFLHDELFTILTTGMDGSFLDPMATGLPIVSLGVERDGFRNGRLAINASMGNGDESWAGVYVTPVPEPSTFLLLGAGLAGLGFVVRRRRKE